MTGAVSPEWRRLLMASVAAGLLSPPAPAQEHFPVKDPRVERIVQEISPARIRATVETLAGFGTRHSLSDTAHPERGIGAARRWIKEELERYAAASGGRMTAVYQEFVSPVAPRVPEPTVMKNVLGWLRPAVRDPFPNESVLLITAHYDSRASDPMDPVSGAPGADDDASGVAVVLELARVLSRAPLNASVAFLCLAGEEQGLMGAKHTAERAQEEGLQVIGVLNNDIVGSIRSGDGRVDSMSVRVFAEGLSPQDTGAALVRRTALGHENDGASRSLARYCKEVGEGYVPGFSVRLVYRADRFLRGGDHTPFHQRGMAAVRFSEACENYDHQHQNVRTENGRVYGDLPEFVNAAYCAQVARVNAAVAASLALAPPRPQGAVVNTRELSYDTELRWRSVPGAAGYAVRLRETSVPLWKFAAFTADTTVTLKVSKDDFLFGIQAVSRAGNPSLYALPVPAR